MVKEGACDFVVEEAGDVDKVLKEGGHIQGVVDQSEGVGDVEEGGVERVGGVVQEAVGDDDDEGAGDVYASFRDSVEGALGDVDEEGAGDMVDVAQGAGIVDEE